MTSRERALYALRLARRALHWTHFAARMGEGAWSRDMVLEAATYLAEAVHHLIAARMYGRAQMIARWVVRWEADPSIIGCPGCRRGV